ncbi:MAG: hypothetical protein ACPMAQ_03620 [Phycisphaerae bacterium]
MSETQGRIVEGAQQIPQRAMCTLDIEVIASPVMSVVVRLETVLAARWAGAVTGGDGAVRHRWGTHFAMCFFLMRDGELRANGVKPSRRFHSVN